MAKMDYHVFRKPKKTRPGKPSTAGTIIFTAKEKKFKRLARNAGTDPTLKVT
jgi:hypothetical protein